MKRGTRGGEKVTNTKNGRRVHSLLRTSAPVRHHHQEREESPLAWRDLVRRIAREGFFREADVSSSFAKRLIDPIFVSPPARVYMLGGVANGRGGGNRFSTIDFFGQQLNRTNYMVVNDEKFRKWASAHLEARFRAKNPHPDRHLAAAFTHYMHDSNLHWSGCAEGKRLKARRGRLKKVKLSDHCPILLLQRSRPCFPCFWPRSPP